MHSEYLNAINAAKAWYRGVMRGVDWRDEAKVKAVIKTLPLPLQRLGHMMYNLERAERSGRVLWEEPVKPPTRPSSTTVKRQRKSHLRIVK